MAIGDLFKTKQEREKEANRKRRKAFRDAEGAKDSVADRVKKLKKERDGAWLEARKYLKEGQKGAAQRSLQAVRATEMMMTKLTQKRWVFEQLLTKLEMAKTDQDFAAALGAINTVVKIDPDAVEDVLGEVEDKLGDQVDMDKIWGRQHEKEMEGVEASSDTIPSMEDMAKQLEDEVAADLGDSGTRSGGAKEGGAKEKIGDASKRLKDMLG